MKKAFFALTCFLSLIIFIVPAAAVANPSTGDNNVVHLAVGLMAAAVVVLVVVLLLTRNKK